MSRSALALCLLSFVPAWLVQYAPLESDAIIFSTYDRDGPYFEVKSEREADLVLVVDFAGPREHQATFYVKKNWWPKKNGVGTGFGAGFSSCGVGKDGKGSGFSGSESLRIDSKGLFEVSLSYSWLSTKSTGEFKQTFTLPWRGEAKLEIDGVKVHAYFRAPVLASPQK